MTGTLIADDGRQWRFSRQLIDDQSGFFRDFELAPATTGKRDFGATACFRVGLADVDLGGARVDAFPSAESSTVGGRPIVGRDVSVRFLTREHTGSRRITRFGDATRRATLFKHVPGGSGVIWLLLAGFAAGLPYWLVRTSATLSQLSWQALARRASLAAGFAGVAWALMLPPLHGADESEHFAYAQYVAEAGQRADAGPTDRHSYSSAESLLLGAIRHSSTVLDNTSRVRWDSISAAKYQRAVAANPARDDGGGYTESASGHSPLYYGLMAVPYKLADGQSDIVQTTVVMRVFNALLAALVAGLAVWTAALLFPRLPETWWLAGVLAGLQPVFSSISGTINNDTLVNLLSAIAVTSVVHAWRTGPRRRNMSALGISAALLPIAKITGFALWPALAIGLGIIVVSHHHRRDLAHLLLVPATGLVVTLTWIFTLAPLFGGQEGALVNVHTASPTVAANVVATLGVTTGDRINYLLQTFLPFIHIGRDVWSQAWPFYSIYIERGYGRFGWLDAGLPSTWLTLVTAALIGGWAAAISSAVRHRRSWRQWFPGVVFLVTVVASVVSFVAAAYASNFERTVPGEQGRYIFPALVPLAVLLAAAIGLPTGRPRALALGATTSIVALFALFAWTAALLGYYT